MSDVLPDLEFLDGAARFRFPATVLVIGPDGGSFDLPDGSRILLESSALDSEVEFEVIAIDVELGDIIDPPPELAVYSLSTSVDVELDTPLVWEIPVAEPAFVLEPMQGSWRAASSSGDGLEFDHFSTQTRVVATPLNLDATFEPIDPRAERAAEMLTVCLQMFAVQVAEADRLGLEYDQADRDLHRALALKICTETVVQDAAGFQPIRVACVGDWIEQNAEATLVDAIDGCLAETEAPSVTSSDGGLPDSTEDSATNLPIVFRGTGSVSLVMNLNVNAEAGRPPSGDLPCPMDGPLEVEMTLRLLPDQSALLEFGDRPKVIGSFDGLGWSHVCELTGPFVHEGGWSDEADGRIFGIRPIDPAGEPVSGTINGDTAVAEGDFGESVLSGGNATARLFVSFSLDRVDG